MPDGDKPSIAWLFSTGGSFLPSTPKDSTAPDSSVSQPHLAIRQNVAVCPAIGISKGFWTTKNRGDPEPVLTSSTNWQKSKASHLYHHVPYVSYEHADPEQLC